MSKWDPEFFVVVVSTNAYIVQVFEWCSKLSKNTTGGLQLQLGEEDSKAKESVFRSKIPDFDNTPSNGCSAGVRGASYASRWIAL